MKSLILRGISKSSCLVGCSLFVSLLMVAVNMQAKYSYDDEGEQESLVVNNSGLDVYLVVKESVEKSCREKCSNSVGAVLGGGVIAKGQSVTIESLVNNDLSDHCHLTLVAYEAKPGMNLSEHYKGHGDLFLFKKKHVPFPFGGRKLNIVKSHECCAKAFFGCKERCCTKKCVRCCPKVCKPKCEKPCKPKCPKPCKPKCEKVCKPKCEKPCKVKKTCKPCVKTCKPKCEKPRCGMNGGSKEVSDSMDRQGDLLDDVVYTDKALQFDGAPDATPKVQVM